MRNPALAVYNRRDIEDIMEGLGEPNPFNAPGVTDDAARDMLAEALDRHFGA